jgi:hypothetical protein
MQGSVGSCDRQTQSALAAQYASRTFDPTAHLLTNRDGDDEGPALVDPTIGVLTEDCPPMPTTFLQQIATEEAETD